MNPLEVGQSGISKAPRPRWIVPTSLTTLGVVLGGLSWLLRVDDPWWSGMLVNAAIVFLLLVPGEIALREVHRAYAEIKSEVRDVKEVADTAMASAGRTERSLEGVRDALLGRQTDEHEAEVEIYRNMLADCSRQSILDSLRRATAAEIITPVGVRSPVWWTSLHYRYVVDGPKHELEVLLERDDGEVLSRHPWSLRQSAIDFYQSLVVAVRTAGGDLGTGLNDPMESIEELSKMLVDVVGLRSQEPMGHRDVLRLIIERVEGWYFTEVGVIPADHLSYMVAKSRLDEMDWAEHLEQKGWYQAEMMIRFARRLYRVEPTRQ